jgi:hypothetical protein
MQRAITVAPRIIALEIFIFILLFKNRIIATWRQESHSRSPQGMSRVASFISTVLVKPLFSRTVVVEHGRLKGENLQ